MLKRETKAAITGAVADIERSIRQLGQAWDRLVAAHDTARHEAQTVSWERGVADLQNALSLGRIKRHILSCAQAHGLSYLVADGKRADGPDRECGCADLQGEIDQLMKQL